MDDPEMLAQATASVVRDVVQKHLAPVVARLNALERDGAAPAQIGSSVAAMVMDAVKDAVAAIPPAEPGTPGVGVAGAMIDRDGALQLTLSDGQLVSLGRVVGTDAPGTDAVQKMVADAVAAIPPPKDGDPGRDAFRLEDFAAELADDGRTIKMSFLAGDMLREFAFKFPTVIYRGVYRPGQEWDVGDAVSCGGSLWHCGKAGTRQTPGQGDDWQLMVKRGRDAKEPVHISGAAD